MLDLLKLISVDEILFFKHVNPEIKITFEGKYEHYNLRLLSTLDIDNFFDKLDDYSCYAIIPYLSTKNDYNVPVIILSDQFLLSKYSNKLLLLQFLEDRKELAK